MEKKERKLAKDIATYLNTEDIIYRFDIAADLRVPMPISANLKRTFQHDKSYPDLFIPLPNDKYHGIYVELKASKEVLYKKNGEFRTTEHLVNQVKYMNRLFELGYYTTFCCSLEEFKTILYDYKNNRL